jgi:hypothetical protein
LYKNGPTYSGRIQLDVTFLTRYPQFLAFRRDQFRHFFDGKKNLKLDPSKKRERTSFPSDVHLLRRRQLQTLFKQKEEFHFIL